MGVTPDTNILYTTVSGVGLSFYLCRVLLLSLQLSVLTEKQICCTHSPVQERSSTLSPQVLQPVCSDIQGSSGGEEDLDPCGDDQEPGQLGDVS